MSADICSATPLTVTLATDEYVVTLNPTLVKKQQLSQEQIELLKLSHIHRALLFKVMNMTTNQNHLIRLAKLFEDLEFTQQDIWGFGRNKSMHRWFDVPKCTCPRDDNEMLLGNELNYYSCNCIIHGDFIEGKTI